MNFHNMTQKNLFESCIVPSPIISRCYSSKANAFNSHLPGNSLYSVNGYLGNMTHFSKKNTPFGPGHLKMPPLEHRANELCDPLVKIVGGFVGSKSQAGTTNHRGREFSLWDVIVDKIIETMENPEHKLQGSRKSGDSGKKNGKIHKIESFTMIGVGQYGPKCTTGAAPNFNISCLEKEWCPPSKTEINGTVYVQNNFPGMGVCHTSNFSSNDRQTGIHPKSFASWNFCGFEDLSHETETATSCKREGPLETFEYNAACPDVQTRSGSDKVTDFSPNNLLRSEPEENQESPLPCSFDGLNKLPNKINQQVSTHLDCADADPKHILRPEAAEFTPRIPFCTLTSLESESEDTLSADLLSSSCESQTQSDTFLRPNVQRTLSECSVDSDDSFIVFESAEDDPVIVSEDSDDEDACSDEDLDEIDNPILFPHNIGFSQPPPFLSRLDEANKKWTKNYTDIKPKASDSATKKVKFAEGNNLVRVKHLIAWGFAHRAARIGPWEMYHRDSERFKSRITSLSAILSPILAKRHREKIYTERFQT